MLLFQLLLMYSMSTSALVAHQRSLASSSACGGCDLLACQPVDRDGPCLYGVTTDICQCCPQCYKGDSEWCSQRGVHGKCAPGLYCHLIAPDHTALLDKYLGEQFGYCTRTAAARMPVLKSLKSAQLSNGTVEAVTESTKLTTQLQDKTFSVSVQPGSTHQMWSKSASSSIPGLEKHLNDALSSSATEQLFSSVTEQSAIVTNKLSVVSSMQQELMSSISVSGPGTPRTTSTMLSLHLRSTASSIELNSSQQPHSTVNTSRITQSHSLQSLHHHTGTPVFGNINSTSGDQPADRVTVTKMIELVEKYANLVKENFQKEYEKFLGAYEWMVCRLKYNDTYCTTI